MKRLLLIAWCGCNQVYGLDSTQRHDGATPDAPFTCPAIGATPAFARAPHQVPLRGCTDYTISTSAKRAVAVCYPNGVLQGGFVGEGTTDQDGAAAGDLSPIFASTIGNRYFNVRLTPNGNILYAQLLAGATARYERYVRAADGTYALAGIPFRNGFLSTIANDGTGDRALLSSGRNYEEIVETGGTWGAGRMHTPEELGVNEIAQPNLSPDGLRLVFWAHVPADNTNTMFYSDRAQVGIAFRTASRLEGVPFTNSITFLTEDCSRIYIAGLDRTFYVQQR